MAKRGRPRKLNPDKQCPNCGSNWVVKNGSSRGKKKWLCKNCGKTFYEGVKYHRLPKKTKEKIIVMRVEGYSISSIARTLNLKYATVYNTVYRSRKFFLKR